MALVFPEIEPDYAKARWLWPFAARYRPRHQRGLFGPGLRLIADEILVVPELRVALVKNSKAGCTYAAQVLHAALRGAPFDGDVHRPDIGLLQAGNDYRAIRKAFFAPNTFRLTTVRHPVRRAVSGFVDFFLDRRNARSDLHLPAITRFGFDPAADAARNFDAYLDMLQAMIAADVRHMDRHFRPQVLNTAHGHVTYDAICHVENLAAELAAAMRAAGVATGKNAADAVEQRNSSVTPFQPSAAQVARIERLYAADFAAFGYKRESL